MKRSLRICVYCVDGLITWIGSDSPVPIEYVVVSNNPNDLDKSVYGLLEGPFESQMALFSIYSDTVDHHPAKVAEVFQAKKEWLGDRNHHIA